MEWCICSFDSGFCLKIYIWQIHELSLRPSMSFETAYFWSNCKYFLIYGSKRLFPCTWPFFVVASGGNLDSRETIFESLKKIRRPPSHWDHLKCLLVGCNWTEKQPEFDKCPNNFLNNCPKNCQNTIQKKKSWMSLDNRNSLFQRFTRKG